MKPISKEWKAIIWIFIILIIAVALVIFAGMGFEKLTGIDATYFYLGTVIFFYFRDRYKEKKKQTIKTK